MIAYPVIKPMNFNKFSRIRRKEAGFALIVTLSLMILLVIVAVGLLGLSSVALRSASAGKANAEARANARMALILAIGELQNELGPDRRINAAAGIVSDVRPEHSQWLAVYDAWRADETQRPNATDRFRKYLVSGDAAALRNRDFAKTGLGGISIEVLGERTLGTGAAPSDRVRVGLVPLANGRGDYAWWISDENSKAKINAGRDLPASVTPELAAQQNADAAPGSGFRMVEALENIVETGSQPWEMGDDLRSKSLSLVSADLLPGAIRPLGRHFHNLSTVSAGLLTDVRSGRLQRDLSLYLEQDYSPRLRQALYTVNNAGPVINFNPDAASPTNLVNFDSGITMEELWLYYNLYKQVDYNRPASNDALVGIRAAGFPTLLSANSRDAVLRDKFHPYKREIYSQLRYIISLTAEPSAKTPGTFDIRFAVDPWVVLWNPYNVALEYQTGAFTDVSFNSFPYEAEFTMTPGGTAKVHFNNLFNNVAGAINGIVGKNHPIVLQPGESRVLSRANNADDNLSSGWQYDRGKLLDEKDYPVKLLGLAPATGVKVKLYQRVGTGDFADRRRISFRLGMASDSPRYDLGSLNLKWSPAATEFPPVEIAQTLTAENLSFDRRPLLVISHNMAMETDDPPSKPWIWSNPSIVYRRSIDNSPQNRLLHQMEHRAERLPDWFSPIVDVTGGNQAYWGGAVDSTLGTSFFTMRSVPLVPIKSIASFQHSCANGMTRHWKNSPHTTNSFPSNAETLDGYAYLAPMGSKLIGNSFSHPLMGADKTHGVVQDDYDRNDGVNASPRNRFVADHAYLANSALWDSWYFSSLTPQTAKPFGSAGRPLQQVFDDFFPTAMGQAPVPLPAARMVPNRASSDVTLRSLVQNNTPSVDAYRKLAAHLMVDGAFNVNSVSVEAWKVMLGSLRGHTAVDLRNSSGGVSVRPAVPESTPVTGLLAANGNLAKPTGNLQDPDQWTGYRSVNDAQIGTLATELVAEIKERGPFLSLSDFVNRRPGSNNDFAHQGTLQAAIEDAELNEQLDKGSRALGTISGVPNPKAGEGSRTAGMPGYISQADLLTPLGSTLRARSDTFTIRSYGRATDSSGKVLSEAWCEAVVQRVPEYVDAANAPDIQDTDASQINRNFGRRFRIVGFRWLNDAEI